MCSRHIAKTRNLFLLAAGLSVASLLTLAPRSSADILAYDPFRIGGLEGGYFEGPLAGQFVDVPGFTGIWHGFPLGGHVVLDEPLPYMGASGPGGSVTAAPTVSVE